MELLVGHGIDLNVADGTGLTALHRVLGTKGIVGITDDSPELSKVKQDPYECVCSRTSTSVCAVGPLLVCVQWDLY